MRIRAVVFDIGLYRPAFEEIEKRHGLRLTEDAYEHIGRVLTKYNARITPRDREVSSDIIFSEILAGTGIPEELKETVKEEFYGYFRRDAHVYPEAEEVLKRLKEKHIVTATLSDVAYGMDNEYRLPLHLQRHRLAEKQQPEPARPGGKDGDPGGRDRLCGR